jgi:RimJ/RimL family protein N-acetyltransferase
MSAPRPLSKPDLEHALPLLLASDGTGGNVALAQLDAFRAYLDDPRNTWVGWQTGTALRPTGLVLAVVLPGRTAIVMVPPHDALADSAAEQPRVLRHALAELAGRRLHYVQALVEPDAPSKQVALAASGFARLAPLLYLERDARYPWIDPPDEDAARWITYSAATHDTFGAVLLGTYEQSRDCPELAGLRPVDDILRSHQATGEFLPESWYVVEVDRAPAGCLLLTHLHERRVCEIVYMGVVPRFRQRGIGRLLLEQALARARATDARQVAVVVDERNVPARRLYERVGFRHTARRDAFLHTLRADAQQTGCSQGAPD